MAAALIPVWKTHRSNPGRCRSFAGLLLVVFGACEPYVEGHAVATHTAADAPHVDATAVQLSALTVPEGAAELGIVQAHVIQGSIEDAIPEFRAQVARLGGDFGNITDVSTQFELKTQTSTETYNCGSSDKPSSCTRTVTRQVEVATTRVLGKAYRRGVSSASRSPTRPAEARANEPAPAAPPATAAPTDSPSGPEGATTAP